MEYEANEDIYLWYELGLLNKYLEVILKFLETEIINDKIEV